jgi:N utilization substance protein B
VSEAKPRQHRPLQRRAAARLAAVQALYQIELGGGAPAQVAREFADHRLATLLEPLDIPSPDVDREHFARVVLGTSAERARLDDAIAGALAAGWTLDRLGSLPRACLRAGAYELAACPDVPHKVVINEYVEVAKLFLEGEEPGFVNAVLDRIAPTLRPVASAP